MRTVEQEQVAGQELVLPPWVQEVLGELCEAVDPNNSGIRGWFVVTERNSE